MRSLAVLTLLAGCYEPEARDCTVECAAADDCADGQVCGAEVRDRKLISGTSTCTGNISTCTVTPVSLTQVGAKFE